MIESSSNPEPDRRGSILYVGQDRAGHWLVQENHGLLEGRFISRHAAWRFARDEVHAFPGAAIVFTTEAIVPSIPFEPAPTQIGALDRAA
ncbi:hypothetical protein [Novosphingobium kaempferiae]|uniref:hypothetical protein n=1 Tax=Novosphingobium kaempferiae TaxID=2896849 RepID=UPI001E5E54CA|nr:hypothetical protein [Novosphingobium kaempferiae]